jgi:hypothetical protein
MRLSTFFDQSHRKSTKLVTRLQIFAAGQQSTGVKKLQTVGIGFDPCREEEKTRYLSLNFDLLFRSNGCLKVWAYLTRSTRLSRANSTKVGEQTYYKNEVVSILSAS